MFMEIAIGAIGIGVILMVGYVIVSQIRGALPDSSTVSIANPCYGLVGTNTTGDCVGTYTNVTVTDYTATACGTTNLTGFNSSAFVDCPNVGYTSGTTSVQATVFAGFGLIAVGIIVLAAFGLISIFK